MYIYKLHIIFNQLGWVLIIVCCHGNADDHMIKVKLAENFQN